MLGLNIPALFVVLTHTLIKQRDAGLFSYILVSRFSLLTPTTWRPQGPQGHLEVKGVRIPRPQWLPLAKSMPAEVEPAYSATKAPLGATTPYVLTTAVKLNKTISQEEDNEDIVLDEEMLAMIARWPAVMEARQRAGGTLPPTRDQKFLYTIF